MASNDFLVFAGASGANVVSQSTYASLAALGPGFATGIAESNQLNKVWRQSSIMAAVLGQLIADISGQNATDDGTIATLLGNLLTTILAANYAVDTGVANSYSLTYSPALVVPLTDGATYTFKAAHSNTGASSLAINGSGAHSIVDQNNAALIGGEIVANGLVTVTYSTALSSFVLRNVTLGSNHSPTATPGSNNTFNATTAFVTAAVAAGNTVQVIASVNASGTILHQNGPVTISVTHTGTGDYTVHFTPNLPTANYSIVATPVGAGALGASIQSPQSAASCQVLTYNPASDTLQDEAFNIIVAY